MESFSNQAEAMLLAMTAHAQQQAAQGVALVARLDQQGLQWESKMRVVETLTLIPSDPENHAYPGYNFLAIAYSKAAEMVDSKRDSGSNPSRPILQGEWGYSGGLIKPIVGGWVLAVFSGASGNLDSEISRKGLDLYEDS